MYKQAGIPVPKGIDVSAGTKFTDEEIEQIVTDLGLPIFVKPAANGSVSVLRELRAKISFSKQLKTREPRRQSFD